VLSEEAHQRNFQRWPVLGEYVWPNYYVGPTFESEITWLKNWISDRLVWLDENIQGMVVSVESEFESQYTPTVSVYPNPFRQELNVLYSYTLPGMITVQLRNVLGQIVSKEEIMIREPGSFETQFETSRLPKGVYLLSVQQEFQEPVTAKIAKE
jgi:hypothetical protein